MASYRRHATTPYAVARAKRYLRRHMLETPPRHHGGPIQSYASPFKSDAMVADAFADFRSRLGSMTIAVKDVPLPDVGDRTCGADEHVMGSNGSCLCWRGE